MPTKVWIVVADSDTGETFHIDEADADVHVEHSPGRERVTLHVRRRGAPGEWPPVTLEAGGAARAVRPTLLEDV